MIDDLAQRLVCQNALQLSKCHVVIGSAMQSLSFQFKRGGEFAIDVLGLCKRNVKDWWWKVKLLMMNELLML